MGRWNVVLEGGKSFRQWVPTFKGEKLPYYDPWDGCPICGENPLPKDGSDVRTLETRLKLVHNREIHDRWARERREFHDVGDVASRMEPPTEPEAA